MMNVNAPQDSRQVQYGFTSSQHLNQLQPMRLPWWRQLVWQVTVVVLLLMLGLGLALNFWLQKSRQHDIDAYVQKQNLHLAQYIAGRRVESFLDTHGEVKPKLLADTGMYISMINPALTLYLLDQNGNILGHTSQVDPIIKKVDVNVITDFLKQNKPLPLYSEDPIRPSVQNLFSAYPIKEGDNAMGYLFVTLNATGVLVGDALNGTNQALSSAESQRSLFSMLFLIGCASLAIIVMLHFFVTRRIKNLAQNLLSFRTENQPKFLRSMAATQTAKTPHTQQALKKARDEIDQLEQASGFMQERINHQFELINQNERMRRELIGNITHDLHTPLASVQGYIETLLIKNDQLDANARHQYLQTALQNARRMDRRVKELFELSKLESGQIQPTLEPFNLAELLNDVVQGFQLKAEKYQVELCFAQDTTKTPLVHADIYLIERVFQNLIDNAISHTPAGGKVEIDLTEQGSRISASVRDTGSGIAKEDLPYIFDRYWTKPSHDSQAGYRSRVSSGLGLAIVRKILDLHGSAIKVYSALQKGTEFTFDLAGAG